MSISWYTFSSISLFIISALTTHIINEIYLFCSLFFVNHLTFLIIIFKCMSLLILMSAFILFFFMSLNISSILISCITILKLTLHRLAFNEISLIQKPFFFSILLLFFILTQNINKFNYFFIVFMFLHINSILLTSISLVHLTMCYEHAWIDQGSDLTLINLIRASHDAMPSLNLAHFYWTLQIILSTSSHCSVLSSFF